MRTKVNKPEGAAKSSRLFFSKNRDSGFFTKQAKLNVGQPNDKYEQEADRVAEQVVNNEVQSSSFFAPAQPAFIQSKPLAETISPLVQKQEEEEEEAQTKQENQNIQKQEEEEEEAQAKLEVQRQSEEEEEEELLQTKSERNITSNQKSTKTLLKNGRGCGSVLDSQIQAVMENSFGVDFSNVKIHTDSKAVQMNKELGARAFTSGNDIYFNTGRYQPGSESGNKLLAHELTHTVQQGAVSSQPLVQRKPEVKPASPAVKEDDATTTCGEEVEREKKAFKNHGIYGPVTTKLDYGGFDASYLPQTEILKIQVRGKTKFLNGLETNAAGGVKSNDGDLNKLAAVLNYLNDPNLSSTIVNNYYTWSEAQKTEATKNFKARLSETVKIWQAGSSMTFYIDKPCWKDVWANVRVGIDVQDIGTANFTGSKKDHIQINLLKNPEGKERGQIDNLIKTTKEKVEKERMQCIDTSADLTTTANVASDNVMTLTNFDLKDAPGEKQNFNASMLRESVLFGHNKWNLDSSDKKTIDNFLKYYKNVDKNDENSKISLIGHASKAGSTEYNRRLVSKRLNSVYSYLKGKGVTNIVPRQNLLNRSDELAEKYNVTGDKSRILRRVELVVGSGELQNTVAHEFGHVFKLEDEYVTPKDEEGSGKPMGKEVGHSGLSKKIGAGKVVAERNDNIMSMGNEVREQHYGPFGKMLNKITGKKWKIF
ncbi:DUF4157 domain-containing protein [Prolixibacteraceae bacterium Z1-6]|uniref:DUF4157 domain-containing protein n=1 Tax=Draconibacterium aestuarii TaxID=2998507 RepID=A0A9X3F383_9BACT|nr:DUF4157 domain-containing protein [Prolixibacteraceae bacterium Z1-6]